VAGERDPHRGSEGFDQGMKSLYQLAELAVRLAVCVVVLPVFWLVAGSYWILSGDWRRS
jgi:hypothetical protein